MRLGRHFEKYGDIKDPQNCHEVSFMMPKLNFTAKRIYSVSLKMTSLQEKKHLLESDLMVMGATRENLKNTALETAKHGFAKFGTFLFAKGAVALDPVKTGIGLVCISIAIGLTPLNAAEPALDTFIETLAKTAKEFF